MKFKLPILIFLIIGCGGCKKEPDDEVKNDYETMPRLVGSWRLERSGLDVNENDSLDGFELDYTPYQTRRIFTKDFSGHEYYFYDDRDSFGFDFSWSFVGQDTTKIHFVRHDRYIDPDSFLYNLFVLNDSQLVLQQDTTEFFRRKYYFEFKRE